MILLIFIFLVFLINSAAESRPNLETEIITDGDILKKRYARGEIDRETYLSMINRVDQAFSTID